MSASNAANRAAVKIYFRLVVQHKFLPFQRAAQADFDGLPLDGLSIHVLLENL
jgi:hypothetical protein